MAKKVILKDSNDTNILPITRGELILDSSGNQAFHSNEFLATDSQPGLMSAEDKQKLETVAGNTIDTELSNTSTNPVQNKVLTQIINSIRDKYLKSAVVSGNKVTITDQSNNTVEFVNSTYQIVTNTVDGLVPKYDAVDGTIDTQTTDWVLTNHNGSLGWYKLPTAAFSSSSVQLFVGAKSADNNNNNNSATTNGNTYLKLFDNSTLKNQYNIKGTGLATVISDDDGTITINVPTSHNQASSDINSLTGYTKATTIAAITTSDSLNTALGKLELKADTTYDLVKGAYDGDGTIENLAEILKVLEGIKDTDTIQAIVGKYLPLSGGTITGVLSVAENLITAKTIVNKSHFFYVRDNANADWIVTDKNWQHEYNLIHSGNIGSQTVAAANKLSTARTIWGQSFDGSGDVNGDLSGVGSITRSFLYAVDSDIAGNVKFKRNDSTWSIISSSDSYYLTVTASSGSVGIGTTSPEALLHVAGNIIANGDILVKGQMGGSNNAWRIVKSGDTLYVQAKDVNGGNNGSIALCGHNATKASRITLYSDDIYLQGSARIDGNFYLKNGGYITAYDASEAAVHLIRLSPANVLEIGYNVAQKGYNTSISGNNLILNSGGTPTERMRITSDGNVGIGTIDPKAKLHVNGTIYGNQYNASGNKAGAALILNKGSNWVGMGPSGGYVGCFSIGTVNSDGTWLKEIITFGDEGNVGIGATNPQYKLDVNGIIHASEFRSLVSDDHYKMLEMGVIKGRLLRVHTAAGISGVSGRMAALSLYEGDSCYGSIGVTTTGPVWIDSSNTRHELLHSGSNLITIEKTLTVSKDWIDTGIIFDSATFPTGTGSYMVQLSRDSNYYYTGYLSVIISSNVTSAKTDEIILHGGGFDMTAHYYLRTVLDADNKVTKLQIARSNTDEKTLKFTFKFKKLI